MNVQTNESNYSLRFKGGFPSSAILFLLIILRMVGGWYYVLFRYDQVIQNLTWVVSIGLIYTFIWINRSNLAVYNFDKLAIIFILIFNPIAVLLLPLIAPGWNSQAAYPNPFFWAIIIISIGMYIAIRPILKTLPSPSKQNWMWILYGSFFGIIINLLLGLAIAPFYLQQRMNLTLDYSVFLAFPYQIGYAGAYEEPLFRGILWGKSLRWLKKTIYANFFQAFLFMLCHGYILAEIKHLPAFITPFIFAFLLGIIVKYSHSVSATMVTHGCYNAFSFYTNIILYQWMHF